MNKYLTIGEVAKLKNMTIESLRHYDRIGLLTPSYTNPKTSYRYYDTQQLQKIDIINYCKRLNIPLKDIKEMFAKADNKEFRTFLSSQKNTILNEIKLLENILKSIEKFESRMDNADSMGHSTEIYYKNIEERNIIFLEYIGKSTDEESILAYSRLCKLIQYSNLQNLYQGGFIYNYTEDKLLTQVIFECVKGDLSSIHANITNIPAGRFICLNYEFKDKDVALNKFITTIQSINLVLNPIIDTYLIDGIFDTEKRIHELQMYITT